MQKHVNLVHLRQELSNQYILFTSIYLQTSASIQPRTSLHRFGGNFSNLSIHSLGEAADVTTESGPADVARATPPRPSAAPARAGPARKQIVGALQCLGSVHGHGGAVFWCLKGSQQ